MTPPTAEEIAALLSRAEIHEKFLEIGTRRSSAGFELSLPDRTVLAWSWSRAPMEFLLAAAAEATALREELKALRRRCQKAEAANRITVEDCRRQGLSIGRALANAGYAAMEAEATALRDERDGALRRADQKMMENDRLRVLLAPFAAVADMLDDAAWPTPDPRWEHIRKWSQDARRFLAGGEEGSRG